MTDIVEFLTNIVGLGEGEKVELRLLRGDEMSAYFFQTPAKAVEYALTNVDEAHVFFGVAPRGEGSSGRKGNVSSVSSLWIDLDRKGRTRLEDLRARLDLFPLPPSYIVSTGGGFHAYWRLEASSRSKEAELLLRSLRERFRSDNVVDCTRVLRLPGTLNHKYNPPRDVKVVEDNGDLLYNADHLSAAVGVNELSCRLIAGEDAYTFKSRSERDYTVMSELIRNGADYEMVEHIFSLHPIGDKYEECIEEGHGEDYLKRTFESASEAAETTTVGKQAEFVPFDDCYYVGDKRVSTFVIIPQGILEGASEDSLVCTVRSRGYAWHNEVFSRRAFDKADSLRKRLRLLSWQWLGTDAQARALLGQLVDELMVDGAVPKARSTEVIGRHGDMWVAPDFAMTADETFSPATSPLSYISMGKEAPSVQYTIEEDDDAYRELLTNLLDLVVKVNRPEVVYPVLSWFMATPQKPVIEPVARFPILMLFGTRGSGKTSLLQNVFQRVIGYNPPRSYDCATTKFSMLALLGSTNAVPVSFKEFRSTDRTGEEVQRMVRLAYDVGYDVRGRQDQTTTPYPLTAPITLDGEDFVSDPASMERMVAVCLQPETILPNTEASSSFNALVQLPLEGFIGRYLQFCLSAGGKLLKGWHLYLNRAQSAVKPAVLPARVSSNFAVLFYGLRLFQTFLTLYELKLPSDTSYFKESLEHVFSTEMGRTTLAVDDFVSDVVNGVAMSGGRGLVCKPDEDGDVLWIHLRTAYSWWSTEKRRRGEPIIGQRALQQQLGERVSVNGRCSGGQYIRSKPKTIYIARERYWMYPIDVKAASEVLDTPYPLAVTQFVIRGSA